MGGISIWQLLIIAVIVVLLFGTNKLRTLGSDLGASIKGFKKAMNDDEKVEKSDLAEKNSHDADFETQNIAEKPTVEQSEKPESKNKEQV
ncbi:twin-arginine translocase subunit TatE [Xenorhabdus sp. 12]|uniref:Sec-independent protein translocase protein TatA n=1 Tax=Xenorhabdus santafensis TaxID=2582833 RepID=A0ABU4SCK1_9GAMM|nr:Sec-independent protein translocase subunit TatA [Xenorhabdus sp. 12]MDX7988537.1 twin-arginine translocase subunit TatE [Xenorhabdus sp. 12]